MTQTQVSEELRTQVAVQIIEVLNLEIDPSEIDPDGPLYGEGLGLDSIDILEIALIVSKRYGIQIKADGPDNTSIFSSLNSLCRHIMTHRTR